MKKILLSAIIIMTAGAIKSFAGTEVETTHNFAMFGTKPWGCAWKDEIHEDNTNVWQLNCYGPGEVICQFKDGTCPTDFPPAGGEGNVRQAIVDQVHAGHLTGEIRFPTGSFSWKATDEENFSCSIIQLIQE